MKPRKIPLVLIVGIFSSLLSGCSSEDDAAESMLSEVNDENCRKEVIALIEPKSIREELSSACARRGTFKHSSGRTWGLGDLW